MLVTLLMIRMMAALLALSGDAGMQEGPGAEEGADPPAKPAPTRGTGRAVSRMIHLAAMALPVIGLLMGGLLLLEAVGVRLPGVLGDAFIQPKWKLGIALSMIAIWAVYLLWRVPEWQAASWAAKAGLSVRDQVQIENQARESLGQLLSGLAVVAGLIFAWQQFGSTAKQVQISQEQLITDRFTNAVEQMGSENLSVRLGGIYALERIARDSPRDLVPSLEVLAAFVREKTVATMAATPALGSTVHVPADVTAALKVIGRRDAEQVEAQIAQGSDCLDLTGITLHNLTLPTGANLSYLCLTGSDLRGANLPEANFSFSDVQFANLAGSNLDNTRFDRAELTGAQLDQCLLGAARFERAAMTGSNLSRSQLDGASFDGAFLLDADLSQAVIFGGTFAGADMSETNLEGAILVDVDFSGAVRLSQEQIQRAVVSGAVKLPQILAATPEPAGS